MGSYSGAVYTVKRGDTLYRISRMTGTSVKDIARMNNIPAPYTLEVGQQLRVNGSSSSSAKKSTTSKGKTAKVTPSYAVPQSSWPPVGQRCWIWPASGKVVVPYSLSEGGNKGIDITHNGEIVSTGVLTGNIGIYAKNDTTISGSSVAKVTLNSGSKIDVSSASSSIGVYLENVDLIDNGGDIKIGKDGTGIFIGSNQAPLHSIVMSSGGIIESTSDNSKGIYTDVDLTSSKHIILSGKESIGIQTYQNSIGTTINSIVNQGIIDIGNSSSVKLLSLYILQVRV